ncbi:unnamed protein product [Notodromas monacha]|uniref:Transmembrane protein 242 n=1 Tax=Notodromas monacha TaxID=399045 RepID=A0A7R9C0Z7_9CRUS|nr:unnamed protein product [Notodromas monacha]CAG0924022.1 unnamed protein product [Notodromas monacha]
MFIQTTVFLSGVAGASLLFGFGSAVAMAKKKDPTSFSQGMTVGGGGENGASLALRALGRGTVYAVLGVSVISWGVWKLSGAENMKDFWLKVQSIFPQVKKNEPPVGRTEFDGFRDLFEYLSGDYSRKK